MKYLIQEYTSIIDGKVRFRITPITKDLDGFIYGHTYGPHDGWDHDRAKMEIDNLRLERRIG